MRYVYKPHAEQIEARRRGAMDVLGALLLALCVGLPFAFYLM